VEVITGARFTTGTLIEKVCVANRPPTSVTVTVTGKSPTATGVQAISPVAEIVMPAGAATSRA